MLGIEEWIALASVSLVVCFGVGGLYVQLGSMKEKIGGLYGEMGKIRGEMKEEIGKVRGEIKEEIGKVRVEMGELKGEMGELKGEMGELKGEMGEIRGEMRGEFKVLHSKIDTLKESNQREHQALEKRLESLEGKKG